MKSKLIPLFLCGALTFGLLAGCGAPEQPAEVSTAPVIGTETTAPQEHAYATTEQVQKALTDPGSVVLDARKTDAYNGWALDGAVRGGHIAGAKSFAADWLTSEYDDKNNLEQESREQVLAGYVEDKGLTADKNIILYDTNGTDAAAVAAYLRTQGLENISLYDANVWLADEALPMDSYENYELLVPAEVVHEIVSGNVPADFTDAERIILVDVSWGGNEESGYTKGHVPTSIHINTDSFEPPMEYVEGKTEWRLADDQTLVQLLLDNGITSEDCVIVTGPEPMAASRFAVICQYLGVEDVRVMNGALTVWKQRGFELETGENLPMKATEFGEEISDEEDLIYRIDRIHSILADDDYLVVDNRTWEEYIGESTGYSYHDLAGRIEGTVFGYAGKKNSSSMSYYRNLDKTMRSADEIRAMWESCGIDTDRHLVFMCGSGWRAAEVLWDAQVMGLDDVSLYTDGWIAWSNEGNPSLTGTPDGK